MKKELTQKEKDFLEQVMKHRKEKVEGLAYKALAISLRENIPVFELPYYVLQKSRQIIEEAFAKVDFNNPNLQKARKEFLKECLKEIKKNIVKTPRKDEKDETDIRDNQCEPVVQAMVEMLLDDELVFSDSNYFDQILANEESVPLSAAIGGYANALDEKLLMIISEHWRRSNVKLWGVEKEKVTFEMLDGILKK